MKFVPINLDTEYKGDTYNIATYENVMADSITLRVYNKKTKWFQKMEITRHAIMTESKIVYTYAGKMITSVWMRKYTPVNVKLSVTTSTLIGELLA